jgi:hypothetical protein
MAHKECSTGTLPQIEIGRRSIFETLTCQLDNLVKCHGLAAEGNKVSQIMSHLS